MDTLVLKSFLPEIYFSITLLIQFFYNTRITNSLKFNFPLMEKELFSQTLFILFILILFFSGLKLEGVLASQTLISNAGTTLAKLCLTIVSIVTLIVIQQSFKFEKINFPELHTILLLSILGLYIMVSTSDFLLFYLVMEIQALCFYVLAASKRDSIFSVESGIKYFISGSFMSGIYLLGVSLIYGTTGTLNLADLQSTLSLNIPEMYERTLYIFLVCGILLVLCTLLFKVACAPFHFWSPDVYEGAPLYATVVFSVIPKLPLYLFILKFLNSINTLQQIVVPFLIVCGMLSVFIGTFSALAQKRMKRLFVYSSVAQTGYVVLALSVCTVDSFSSAVLFLIVYIITSLLIWSNLITVYGFSDKLRTFYNKQMDSLYITTLSNFFKFNPLWACSFIAILFSIAAIPPLTGFLSKILIFIGLVQSNKILESILVLIISSISVYYYIRVVKAIFFEPANPYTSQEFKTNFDYNELNILTGINVVSIVILIITFYNPTILWIISHKLSLI